VIARFVYGLFRLEYRRFVASLLPISSPYWAGLMVSTIAKPATSHVAFLIVMIFLLMSGLFTPIDGMPEWAKWVRVSIR
jgi:ABC-2 type transport system permease protein